MSALLPCTRCRRHARAGDDCPFCGAPLGAAPPPRRLGAHATRAAILSLGVALGATACGDDRGTADAGTSPTDAGAVADAGTVTDAGTGAEDAGGGIDSGLVVTPYGAPAVDHLI